MARRIGLALIVLLAWAQAGMAQEVKLFDFEPGPLNVLASADTATYVTEHVTSGKQAVKVDLKQKSWVLDIAFFRDSNMAGQWGQYERFVVDVFVEGGPVKVNGFFRDDYKAGWPDRYNFDKMLTPGKRKLEFPLGSVVFEKNQKPIDLAKLAQVAIQFESADPANPAVIYLDNGRLAKGTAGAEVKVLWDFEGSDAGKIELEDYPAEFKGKSKFEMVEDHATAGKKALRLESHSLAGNVQFWPEMQDWSQYDALAIDLFNPSDKPIPVGGWVKGKPTDDWAHRYNWERMVRPGASTVRLPVGMMVDPGGKIIVKPDQVAVFNVSTDNQTLFIDNVRLVKGTEEVAVGGMKKFDFGPKTSAVMPGFTAVCKDDTYAAGKGYGWLPGGQMQRDSDILEALARHRPTDDLCRDFCQPIKASFVVDLPNGEYRGWLMMAPPGARVWTRYAKGQTVLAQGKIIQDVQYDAESFKTWEFRWQDAEDLPGDDLWERYRNSAFVPVIFDFAVSDGKLKLDFAARDYNSSMVCGLVVHPKSQEQAAGKWFDNLANQRKEQFLAMHVETLPPAPKAYEAVTPADQQRGYVRFVHSPDRAVEVNSVPIAQEAAVKSIVAYATPGEYEDVCLGVYPLKDGPAVKLSVSDLKSDSGAVIPAANISAQVLRYKALNHNAVYTIEPKFLDKYPAEGLALKKGVTRSIWLIMQAPKDAAAGAYKGKVTLGDEAMEISLTVWPITLSESQIPMGMFMTVPPGNYLGLETSKEAYWKVWAQVLKDAREHGMNSVDPILSMPLQRIENGKAVIDFTDMDRFMDLAKSLGYDKEVMGYATGTGINLRPQALNDKTGGAAAFGLKSYAELVKAYFDAYSAHAKQKGYLPICFASDDEYLVHADSTIQQCEQYHRILKENAPGVRFVALDSIYPDQRPAEIPAWEKMLGQIDTWGAGLHSPKMSEIVKRSGSRLWLYNTGMNRFAFGTYMIFAHRQWDVQGFFQWVYPSGGTYTDFDLLGHNEAHYGVVYPSTHGLRTTPTWERVRAGCDDHRYLQTAFDLIERSKKESKGAQQATALEKLIQGTFAKLTFGKPDADAISGEGKAGNPMDPAQMEGFRKEVAEGILALQVAMK